MSTKRPSKMINMDTWAHFDYFDTNGISKRRGIISDNWETEFFKKTFMTKSHEEEVSMIISSCGYTYDYQWLV